MNRAVGLVALIGFFLCSGCGQKEPSTQTRSTEAKQTSEAPKGDAHAVGVVPGSYEDWCEEHGVAETQCTRCDPSLIPAFQAVGDWDADHGLPMSQCTIHDPSLKIVRPPKPEAR
jgi:hypothetical protein